MKTNAALVVVDVQNDFVNMSQGEPIIPLINELRRSSAFDVVAFSVDWHPIGHVSFASSHAKQQPYTCVELQDGRHMELWPEHCIQHTEGAALHRLLDRRQEDMVVEKGMSMDAECFSAFGNDRQKTRLEEALRERGVSKVFVVGFVFDVCVGETALDAARLGFETVVFEDATRTFDKERHERMNRQLSRAGVEVSNAKEFLVKWGLKMDAKEK